MNELDMMMEELINDPEFMEELERAAEDSILQQIYERGDRPY